MHWESSHRILSAVSGVQRQTGSRPIVQKQMHCDIKQTIFVQSKTATSLLHTANLDTHAILRMVVAHIQGWCVNTLLHTDIQQQPTVMSL